MSNETKAYASEYMTTEEVAALYHVCKKTVQRWRVAGKLKGVKVGRRWLYTPEAVAAMAEDGVAE